MESAFIIALLVTWTLIALAKGADWLGKGGHHDESDREFLERVWRENAERARKLHEEIEKKYR